jgi:putative acetyltransferase
MILRPEVTSDAPAIRALISTAFQDAPHATGTEADIVDALRKDGALTLSLVAMEAEEIIGHEIIGHVAFSPVVIEGGVEGWSCLGPVAVQRAYRRRGVGSA